MAASDRIEDYKEQSVAMALNKLSQAKLGCNDCSCGSEIQDLSNRVEILQFSGTDFSTNPLSPTIPNTTDAVGNKTITYSQFTTSTTYLDTDYAGDADFYVFLNTISQRFLTFALDGFVRLPQGGFIIDPAKLPLEPTDELIIFN